MPHYLEHAKLPKSHGQIVNESEQGRNCGRRMDTLSKAGSGAIQRMVANKGGHTLRSRVKAPCVTGLSLVHPWMEQADNFATWFGSITSRLEVYCSLTR